MDFPGTVDDVRVGQHQSIGRDHDARTSSTTASFAATLTRVDADDGWADHLRYGGDRLRIRVEIDSLVGRAVRAWQRLGSIGIEQVSKGGVEHLSHTDERDLTIMWVCLPGFVSSGKRLQNPSVGWRSWDEAWTQRQSRPGDRVEPRHRTWHRPGAGGGRLRPAADRDRRDGAARGRGGGRGARPQGADQGHRSAQGRGGGRADGRGAQRLWSARYPG